MKFSFCERCGEELRDIDIHEVSLFDPKGTTFYADDEEILTKKLREYELCYTCFKDIEAVVLEKINEKRPMFLKKKIILPESR